MILKGKIHITKTGESNQLTAAKAAGSDDDWLDKEPEYGGFAKHSWQGIAWRLKDAEKRLKTAQKAPMGSSASAQRRHDQAVAKIEDEIEGLDITSHGERIHLS